MVNRCPTPLIVLFLASVFGAASFAQQPENGAADGQEKKKESQSAESTGRPNDTLLKVTAGPDFSRPYGAHLAPILKWIQANSQQSKQITIIVQQYRPKIEPMQQAYTQKRQEFLNCLTTGAPPETVMSKQMELGSLASDISSKYCMMRLEIRRVLKPNQIVLFEQYRKQQGWSSK